MSQVIKQNSLRDKQGLNYNFQIIKNSSGFFCTVKGVKFIDQKSVFLLLFDDTSTIL